MSVGLVAAATFVSATGPATAATTNDWRFDFGTATSPVADGYTQVTNSTLYSPATGFGLDQTIASRDRGAPDALRRDFVVGSSYTFSLDVPNGDYRVRILSGDQIAGNHTIVALEGTTVADVTLPTGTYSDASYSVTVSDGQLNVHLSKDGRLNAIAVAQIAAPTDVTANVSLHPSPTASLTWPAVDGAQSYAIYRQGEDDNAPIRIGTTSGASFADTTANLGMSYTYTVTAVAPGDVESAASAPVSLTIRNPSVTPPGTPTGLHLETSIAKDTFTLAWTRASHADGYYVYRAEGDGAFSLIDKALSPRYRLYIAPSTPCCYDFRYRVVAVNEGGVSSPSEPIDVSRSATTG